MPCLPKTSCGTAPWDPPQWPTFLWLTHKSPHNIVPESKLQYTLWLETPHSLCEYLQSGKVLIQEKGANTRPEERKQLNEYGIPHDDTSDTLNSSMALQLTMMEQRIICFRTEGVFPPANTMKGPRFVVEGAHRSSPRQLTKAPQYGCPSAMPLLVVKRKRLPVDVVKRKRSPVDIRARRILSRRLAALMSV